MVIVIFFCWQVKMGTGSSKDAPEVDNKGVLNGNVINNGNIIEAIENDISNETVLLKIVITLKAAHILIVLIKMAIKFVKRHESQKRQIKEIMLKANRS